MGDFKRGTSVLYKKPDGAEVEARVISFRPSTKEYNIGFKNGDSVLVKPSSLAADPNAARTTKAKSSSPGRSQSRGRGRSRTRSPQRSSSKGRRSAPTAKTTAKSPARRRQSARTGDSAANDNKANDAKEEKKPKAEEKKEMVRSESASSVGRRKSMRIAAIEADSKTTTKKPLESLAKAVAAATSGKVASKASWLAIVGALLCTVSIPVSFVAVNMMCDKKNCTMRMLSVPKRLATFYDAKAWTAYAGFAVLQAILLVLPVGRRIEGPSTASGRNYYRYNGWFSLLATISALFGLQRYGIPIDIIRTKFFALMTASWVFGTGLSALVYIKNRLRPGRNTYFRGQTGNALVDWHAGRETIPRFGSYFDLKLYGIRLAVNGIAVLLSGLLYLSYAKAGGQVPHQLYVCAGLGLFYLLDFVLRENDYLTTFDYLKTGAGYSFFACAGLYPFVFSLPMRFLHDQVEHKLLVELQTPVLVSIVSLYLVGYLMYLVANRIKNAFRRDPNSKRFTDLETIPTSRGKALIVSAPWGWVRHPNYVGDIIMSLALASTTGFGHVMPFIVPLGLVIMLVIRAHDDETRLKTKYGSAWTRYCQRVPYRFIPKVY